MISDRGIESGSVADAVVAGIAAVPGGKVAAEIAACISH
jgi:hypothetical protein